MMNRVAVLPVNGRLLLYNSQNRSWALVNDAVLKVLETKDYRPEFSEVFFDLRSILQPNVERISRSDESESNHLNPWLLGIIPSRGCNAACVYCGFGTHSLNQKKLRYSTAVSCVDWMVNCCIEQGRKRVDIHFFGGEPLIFQDIVEVVVHRARLLAHNHGLQPYFEVSTNGNIGKDFAVFVAEYFNSVVLSLDGLKNVHDLHRPLKGGRSGFRSAFENAVLFSKSRVNLCIRVCVSDKNVHQMADIAEWIAREIHPNSVTFESMHPNGLTADAGLLPPEPFDFSVNFFHAGKVLKKYGIEIVYPSAMLNNDQISICPVGKDSVIVSPGGPLSECYLPSEELNLKGLNYGIGYVDDENGLVFETEQIKRLRLLSRNKPGCEQCYCLPTCLGGCNAENNGWSESNGYNNFCIQTRIITAMMLLLELGEMEVVHDLLLSKESMRKFVFQETDFPSDNLWRIN